MTWTRRILLVAATTLFATGSRAAEPARPTPADEACRKAAAFYGVLERQETERLGKALDALIADPLYINPFKARDREKLLSRARPKFDQDLASQGSTHWYFIDPEPARACFLRVHSPTLFGDVIQRETLSRAIASHDVGTGKELGKTAFALRVVKPIKAGGQVVGYMELAEELGSFLGKMKEKTGCDFALLIDKQRIDRKELARVQGEDRWEERPTTVLIDSTVWNERLVELPVPFDRLPDEGVSTGEWTDGSRRFVGAAFPVRDASGAIVGALFVRRAG
jgi:hypothetical protein